MQLQVSTGSNNLTADNNLNEGKKAVGGWGMREADSIFFSLLVLPSRLFPEFNPETCRAPRRAGVNGATPGARGALKVYLQKNGNTLCVW